MVFSLLLFYYHYNPHLTGHTEKMGYNILILLQIITILSYFLKSLLCSLSILRHTHIFLQSFAPIYRENFRWMIPGIFTKRFECCYPGVFKIHNRFNIAENRFYFVADFHVMISFVRFWF